MKPGFKPGLAIEHHAVVRPWMRLRLDGLVRHPLYATWAMVYHMEVAARKLLAPYLEPGEEAVGAAVAVDHLAPAAVGTPVRVVCRLESVRGRRVRTRLDVYVQNRRIGTGSHVQAVIPRERFERLSRRAR